LKYFRKNASKSYGRNILHAILAKEYKAVLVSQDKHFQKLKSIVNVKRPEEIS